MRNLARIVEESNYWEYEEGHSKEKVIENLKKMERLSPQTLEYWMLRGFVLYSLAENALELFERGKNTEGMYARKVSRDLYIEILKNEADVGIGIRNPFI